MVIKIAAIGSIVQERMDIYTDSLVTVKQDRWNRGGLNELIYQLKNPGVYLFFRSRAFPEKYDDYLRRAVALRI
jgi:hypothetical protein